MVKITQYHPVKIIILKHPISKSHFLTILGILNHHRKVPMTTIGKDRGIQSIENDIHKLWIEDGIVMKIYRTEINNITLEIAKRLVAERKKICNGKTYPMLVDTNRVPSIDHDAREYLGCEKSCQNLSAIGILSHNPISTIFINFYIKFSQSTIPKKMFNSREKAIRWLNQFRHLN